MEQIAASVGVSRRTFFRYFDSKAAVLWHGFDREVESIRATLAAAPDELSTMAAIRDAVLAVNRSRTEDAAGLRRRMRLLATPELLASAALGYRTWEFAISEFAARRTGQDLTSLYPLAIGRATLAACRAAYDQWIELESGALTDYLDAALSALESGFSDASAEATDTRGKSGDAAPPFHANSRQLVATRLVGHQP